jgi:hypothetical protein
MVHAVCVSHNHATAALRPCCCLQIGGCFVPAGSTLHLSFFIAQLVTDPHLHPAAAAPSSSDNNANASALKLNQQQQQQRTALDKLAARQRTVQSVPADYYALINRDTLAREFRPERWMAAANTQPDSNAPHTAAAADADPAAAAAGLSKPSGLLTFGSGPHVCLGQSLFMMEARVLLALLARRYELELRSPEAYGVRVGFLPRSSDGCRLLVRKLDNA